MNNMKRLLGILALIFVFASSAYATDVTVGASTIPNFNPSNAGSDRTLTVTVNNGSNIVSCSACMPSNTVGLSGFRVNINGTQYVVQSVSTQSLFVLTTLYSGAGGSTSMTLYKYVLFRIYADRAFQPKNKTYIVQPGVPGSSSWYKQVGASIISDGATSSLYLSEMILDATTDAVSPTNQAKYTAAFYRTDNSLVQYYNCFEQFALPATTPTTWTAICTYNSPTAIVPPNRDSYTKSEIDNRFASCSSGQLYYFASSGNVVSCLTLGTNLSITSGVLNATGGGGGGGSNIRQAYNAKVDYSAVGNGVANDTTPLQNCINAAQAGGFECYLPGGTYLVTGLTITGSTMLVGDGVGKTIIYSTTNADILNVSASAFRGATIQDMTIRGLVTAGSSQNALKIDDGSYVFGVQVRNVTIENAGNYGLYVGNVYSSQFENMFITNCVNYPLLYAAPAMPSNTFVNIYIGDVRATAPTGFRIKQGDFNCISCNGINNVVASSRIAAVGRKNGVDGDVVNSGAVFDCTSCNFESWVSNGILSYSSSLINVRGRSRFAVDASGVGTGKPIQFDLAGDGSDFYAQQIARGVIEDSVSIDQALANYANSQAVHANGFAPIETQGVGPSIANSVPLSTYWDSSTSLIARLSRKDGQAPVVSITTSATYSNPGVRYIEANCPLACTITLPWPGWYAIGQSVMIKDISGAASANNITITAGGGGTVNGSTYTIGTDGGSVILMPNNVTLDWRVVSIGITSGPVTGSGTAPRLATWSAATTLSSTSGLEYDSGNSAVKSPARFWGASNTAGAPTFSFTGDNGTGMYLAGATTDLGFAINGSAIFTLNSTASTLLSTLNPDVSNTRDLGATSARWRSGYFQTSAILGTASTTTGILTFLNSTNANTFKIQAGVTGANLTYTLPTAYSSGTQCLADNGTGTLSWTACSGGSSSPGGSNTQVQFNDSGNFNGDSGLTYNKTTNVLSVDHAIITQSDTTIVPLIVKAVGASTAELLQIKDSAGSVRGGYATSGAGFYRGFSSAPTAALANDGKLFYDITGGVTNQQLVLSKNTGQYNPIVVANQASYTANKIPLWSSTSWELENSMMTQGSGAVSLTIAPTASSSGSPTIFTLTGPAHTALAADTEATDVNLNLNRNVQFTAAGGTFSLQRAIRFQSPTYRATGSETISNATLLYLDTPKAGTNMTLTNSYALGISPSALGHHGLYFDFQTSATGNFIEFNSSGSSFGKIVSRTDRANYVFGGHTTSTADTDGFVYIPSVAGVPVGTPTAYTGTAPLTLDSTNNRLYGYMGGAWRNLTGAGGTPGGSNTQLQYNNAGSFGGITGATTNGTFVTLTTPVLGVASATSINKVTLTAPATGSTLTIADGKTLTASNTLTFTGTDASSVAFGTGGTVTYTANNLSVFAATTSAQLAGVLSDETGSGSAVFGTAPTISGGTHTALTSLGIRSTGTGAFDLTLANTENLTLGRTLTLKVNDAARTVDLGGNLTLASSFTTSGANALTLTTSGATNVTLPTSGTLTTTSNNLSVFAATTSAQLAGVLSDETGSGVAVFGTSPAITTSLTTGSASFDLLNTTATTINFGGAATTISMGGTGAAIKLGGGVAAAELRFLEPSGSGVNYIAFKAPALAADITYTWPIAFGSAGQCLSDNGSGTLSWVTCAGGSGLTSLNALTASTQTFAKVDDTNVTLAIGSVTSTHTFTVGWTGTLAKARQNSATVYNDAANTWSTGAQDFGAATSLKVPTSAGAAPTASGLIAYDSTSDTLEFGANTVNRTITTTSNNLSVFAATTSAQLAGVLSDETGSGLAVFATSPTLTTPVLGVATATSINKVALTAPATSATLTIADGKTLTASNTLTFTGTDSSSVAFGTGGTVAYTANNLSVFAATTSAQLAGVLSDETGSGSAVFGTAPTISGGTHTALTSLGIRSTGTGAFDLTLANTENLTAGKTLTLKVNDAARTIDLAGNLTLAAAFSTSGANALTLTTSGATNVTLPTSGTLAVTGNPLSQFAATTSAQLAGVISDETGSGVAVFATSPTLTTPVLGVASATTINKVTLTAPATGSTLTIADGKTLTTSNTLTFTGTDASSVAFGTGGTVTYTANNLSVFAATTSAQLAGVLSDETGSGVAVFGTSPAITTSLTTGSSSFDLLNTTATTINFGGAATAINMAGGSGAVVKLGGGTLAAELRFMEPSGGAEYISFKAPSLASNLTYTWPTAFGSAGQCLSDNGSGTLSWVACSGGGGGTPGGSNKQIQFNNSSAFGGATGFEYQSGASPNVSITAQDISYTPLNVNGLTSQTAPIQTWQLNGANRTVIGEDARSIYIGNGRTSGTGTTGVVSGTEATGTNIGGSGLLLQGGAGTGTGTGGSVMFKTAPTGSSGSSLNAYVIAMEIDSKSNIELGSGLNTTSSTEGFVYVQSVAGLPTGVPGTSYSGTTPTVIDSTNKGFCMYVSGWNCVRPTGGTTSQLLYNNGGYAAGIAGAASNGTTVTFASASLLATSPAITTSLTTSSTTFALINTGATTVNFAGAATTLNMAGGSGAAINLGGGANAAELRFLEPSAGGSQYTAFKAGSQGSNITYTLPTTVAAVDGDVLSSNTSGTLSWITPTPATPPGTIVAYGGSTAPSGWLMCDGAAVSRTGANAALFAIVGTSYGAGNGTTTFNVPDLQQRFPMGKAVSGTGATLGNTGGSIDHTHTSAAHTHGATGLTTGGPSGTAFVPNGTDVFVGNDSHTHTISGSTASTTPGATGSNNPPYVVVNYIIKL